VTAQDTSCAAYAEAAETGRLASAVLKVAHAFEQLGPGTAAEVLRAADLDGNLNLMRARVTDLEDMGLLREVDRRPCEVTGRRARVLEFCQDGAPRAKVISVELHDHEVDAIRQFRERCGHHMSMISALDKILDQASSQRRDESALGARRAIVLAGLRRKLGPEDRETDARIRDRAGWPPEIP
jgi:hypothetical protein